jgi:hypothetical protein
MRSKQVTKFLALIAERDGLTKTGNGFVGGPCENLLVSIGSRALEYQTN